MTADQIVVVSLSSGLPIESGARPSGELPTHLAVYRRRPDVGAIVHTHAPSVTALSVLRRPLPPLIDEMIVYFGGTVEVADYAFTGTDELGANVVAALSDRAGVLLSNHGNLCVGSDLRGGAPRRAVDGIRGPRLPRVPADGHSRRSPRRVAPEGTGDVRGAADAAGAPRNRRHFGTRPTTRRTL